MSHTSSSTAHYPNQPELAIVALLHLLSRSHAKGRRAVSEAIVAHFQCVAEDTRQSIELRDAARQLGMEWSGLLEAADHDGDLH